MSDATLSANADTDIQSRQLALEERKHTEQLALERLRLDQQTALERYRIKTVSVAATITVATITALGGIAVAVVELLSGWNAVRVEQQKIVGEQALEERKEDREFLSTYAEQVIGSDLRRRIEFAEIAIALADTGTVRDRWMSFAEDTKKRIDETEQRIDEIIEEVRSNDRIPAERLASLDRELQRLDTLLDGGRDISIPARRIDVFDLQRFQEFVAGLELRYISAADMLVLGAQHEDPDSPGYNANRPPPPSVWDNMAKVAKVLDEFRHRYGEPIYVTSWYRSPEYNARLPFTSSRSPHLTGMAVDFHAGTGTPSEWATLLEEMRAEGVFEGSVHAYRQFVGVTVRGVKADFGSGDVADNSSPGPESSTIGE